MPGRILVVDDVATNRIILKVKLSTACYDVIQAEGGQQALAIARKEHPDLILLDMSMPDMSGQAVCRRLKANPATADIPVIVVTAHTDIDLKLDALKAGADEFLSKPVDDMELLARIRSLLRARSVAAELALREGTSQALGFAEAASAFTPAGRICMVGGGDARFAALKQQLSKSLSDTIECCSREQVLGGRLPVPDLFIVPADLDWPGGGLLLISELRSNPETRHSGIIVATDRDDRKSASIALDLGASDIVSMPVHVEEIELRLKTMMARKHQADRLRIKLRDGLQMAVTDPLTGLYNRRYAMSHLTRIRERAIAAEQGFAVMLIDLDHFKKVNDTHGHAAGDVVLKSVADLLAGNLRTVDLVSRIGGEEFLAILPNTDVGGACRVAERLCRAVSEAAIDVTGDLQTNAPTTLHQTVSIGLVFSEDGHEEISLLLDQADRALYDAKKDGRDRIKLAQSKHLAA